MGEDLSDLCELLPLIALSVLFCLPEAQRHDSIRLGLRSEDGLVDETGLLAEDRQDLFVDRICEFVGLSGVCADFNYSCEHGKFSFRRLRIERNVARDARRSMSP